MKHTIAAIIYDAQQTIDVPLLKKHFLNINIESTINYNMNTVEFNGCNHCDFLHSAKE